MDPKRPLATFVNQKSALRLEAVCARAADAGLAPGMMLADARAMVPTLQVRAADPAADARLLEDLAAWCERYTPYVAIDRSHPGAGDGALWLDITGCAHLFGGEAALRADLLARLRRQGLTVAAAIADAPGAAWALARYGDDGDADRAAGRRPGGAGAFARGRAAAGSRCRPACWSAWGWSGSSTSIPCRAGRWSRASARR